MVPTNNQLIATGDLIPLATNARTHSRQQVRQIADSIGAFGFTNPVLIDETRTILAGHGRVEAAKLLGLSEVPCLRLDHMSKTEKRAYVLADNKLALNAGWDEDLLAAELGVLMSSDLDFDVSITGFTIPEIDGVLASVEPEEPGDPEDDVIPGSAPRRVHPGDIWQLGPHRLVCGNALDCGVIEQLMDGAVARMVYSDPPYNVPIDGHVGNSGKVQHREFAMASGEMSRAEFTAFLTTAMRNLADHSVDGSIHFLCMDWRHMSEMLEAGQGVYNEMKNLIVWAKDNGGMGRDLLSFASRVDLCVQEGHGGAYQHVRAGSARPLSHQCLGIPGREHDAGRADGGIGTAPDGQTGADGRRCDPRCLWPGRHCAGYLRWIRVDADRGGQDRAARISLRVGSDLLRSYSRPLGELCK